jgi:activator of HSP90 ATPase
MSKNFTGALLALIVLPVALAQSDKHQDAAASPSAAGDPRKSITIHQEIDFTVDPSRVYEALLDSKQFTAFSGRPAEINRELGGAFSVFGGHIIGRNLELVPNQRIVQAWRVVTWPDGAYSIARFELKAQGAGTHLVLDHIGFPEGLRDHLAEGWEQNYWSLLRKYLH